MDLPKTNQDPAQPAHWGNDRLLAWFAAEGIGYQRLDHPPVFTAEEAQRLVPPARGAHAKNLLVEDGRQGRVFMVTVPFEVRVDISGLAAALGTRKLRFVPAERMMQLLGVTPGSVSMLALVNDRTRAVALVLDRSLWDAGAVQCHPLVNTQTLVVDRADLARFLDAVAHAPVVLDVPRALT